MSTNNPIRIVIADDNESVRRGMALFLRAMNDMQLVGEAADGEEALQLCGEINPDVILMDLSMPEMDGIEATRLIRQQYPTIQVIALTGFEDNDLVNAVIQVGAAACLSKSVSIHELRRTIRTVVNQLD